MPGGRHRVRREATMSDDQPTGSCICCARRDPWRRDDGTLPLACGVCLSRLRSWLGEIPDLLAELDGRHADIVVDVPGPRLLADGTPVPALGVYGPAPVRLAAVEPDHPRVLRAGRPIEHVDALATALPAAAVSAPAGGGRVSGSLEPRLPISVDAVDLAAAARRTTSATAPLAYPEQDDDQIGFSPVAATLDGLAEGLRLHRARGERRPFPAVTNLCSWLLDRLDEAADDWPGLGDLFEEVRLAYGALRGQLGLIDVPEYRKGIPCAKCSALTVLRLNGSDFIECGSCPAVLTIPEYEEYTMTLATALTAEERERRKRAAADRKAVFGLLRSMHAVGWRHAVAPIVDYEVETGAPTVEGEEHCWRRGQEVITALRFDGGGTYLRYSSLEERTDGWLGGPWLAEMGVKRLHAVAVAAGVLSIPKERG